MKNHNLKKQAGFTIIEMMVGLVVGLLVVLVATSSASFYEANRRSTVGGNGAQENATAAVSYIQREARMAGMWSPANYACPTGKAQKWNDTTSTYEPVTIDPTTNGATSLIESPITIKQGTATGNTDSIQLTFTYSSTLGGAPSAVLSNAKNGADFAVTTATPFNVNDIVLIAPPSGVNDKDCAIGVITAVQTSSNHLQMRPYGINGGTNGQPSFAAIDFPQNSFIINLGSTLSHNLQINNNNFEVDGVVVAENIVKMLARFGSDTGTGLSDAAWPPSTVNNNSYVLQVILVARSAQREKPSSGNAADACDATTSSNLPKDWAGNVITIQNTSDATRDNGTWQCYRYRALQLQIPLKNLILQSVN